MTTDVDRLVARLGARLVGGPLGGFHNQVFAVDMPVTDSPGVTARRLKLFTHRPGVVWFDLRFFRSQDDLLECIDGMVPRIPQVMHLPGARLHQFIEGRTLGKFSPCGYPLEGHHLFDITELFSRLVTVPLDALPGCRDEHRQGWPSDGDSGGFLRRMVAFTHEQVHAPHEKEYGRLLRALGVPRDCLRRIAAGAARLTPRPFALLHGDLHRENLIVDNRHRLWAIDWELAVIGDPLYDLATHLHLMRYPPDQRAAVIEGWRAAVERNLPGASAGLESDLARYLAFKKVQSVYTDVLREARKLRHIHMATRWTFHSLATRVHAVLARARQAMGVDRVPSVHTIAGAYADWHASLPDRGGIVPVGSETALGTGPARRASPCGRTAG